MSVDVVADTPIVQCAGARHILTSFKLRRSPPPNAFSLSYKNPVKLEKTLISYAVQPKAHLRGNLPVNRWGAHSAMVCATTSPNIV